MKTVFTRFLSVPENNNTKQVEVVDSWAVRWTARSGEFSGNTKIVAEFFLTESDARDFAASLTNAFALVRHTGDGTRVTVEKSAA